MDSDIKVGDVVRLLGFPSWLTHDLPEDEQREMSSFVGSTAIVREIDGNGYFWLGFGGTVESDDAARYSGHSFCVPREFLELTVPAKPTDAS